MWDMMLLPFDAAASLAHAAGLVTAGILTEDELTRLDAAFTELGDAFENGEIEISIEDEDCHTVIERFLTQKVGDVGKKIHTGRSRNDQVVAALRLWLRFNLNDLAAEVEMLIEQLADMADVNQDQFLPGYTHMQRAMPSTVALWAAGYAEVLIDDLDLILQAKKRINASPLGSGAGYGIPHIDLPRQEVADILGFERLQENVTSVQLSRGKYELEVVHALLQGAATINRLASDIVLYSSSEFGFVQLNDALTTGSSIMPQKKNPDIAELARATMHRLSGEFQVLLGIPANLPSGYHRDLQLTKGAVMKAVLIQKDLLEATRGLLTGLSFQTKNLDKARDPDLFATAAALSEVVGGKPFREAYRDAAENPSKWVEQAKMNLSEAYTTVGTPGNVSTKSIRSRLGQIMKR
jgi:argininosuccinate lyase